MKYEIDYLQPYGHYYTTEHFSNLSYVNIERTCDTFCEELTAFFLNETDLISRVEQIQLKANAFPRDQDADFGDLNIGLSLTDASELVRHLNEKYVGQKWSILLGN